MIIYKITNLLNNKIYVGKSELNNPNYYGSGTYITRAIKKYGKENFKKDIIIEFYFYDNDLLNEEEIYWIETLNSKDPKIGYNITKGGDGIDSEFRSSQMKVAWKDPKIRIKYLNSIKKVSNTIESKKKNSVNRISEWKDPKIREKRINARNTIESKNKSSEIQKNRWGDLAIREKTILTMKANRSTEESRRNNSELRKKYYEDPDNIRKTSEASKRGWEKRKLKNKLIGEMNAI